MRKILLVDDEMRMLDLLDLYLSQNGFSCIKKLPVHVRLIIWKITLLN